MNRRDAIKAVGMLAIAPLLPPIKPASVDPTDPRVIFVRLLIDNAIKEWDRIHEAEMVRQGYFARL